MTTRTPDPDAVAIGQAVRGAIAQADLTLAATAEQVNIAVNTFSRRINGLLPFTWPELVRVSAATGVPCSEIVASAERIKAREPAKKSETAQKVSAA